MNEQLNRQFVGVDFNFSQYIEDNIEEALSGVKGENAVKIFGSDLAELERLSKAVEMRSQRAGVKDPGGFSLLGQPNLLVRIDRAKAARYGFSVGDINTVVEAAIGGQEVTRVYENDWNFPLTVRLAPEYRQSIDSIRSIPIALPGSDPTQPTAYIPLGDLGEVKLEPGAAYIYRENSQRYYPLKYSVRGRDLGSTVADAQAQVARNVPLPRGYRLEWGGEFGALQEAKARLTLIVPLSLLLIFMLLYALFNSIRDSLLALAGIPFRCRWRHPRPLGIRPQLERVGGDWVHLAVWRLHDGRHPACLQHPAKSRRRARRRAGSAVGRQHTHAAGLHDGSFGLPWPRACSTVERHRHAGAAAARDRGGRRHAAIADLQPAHDPHTFAHLHAAGGGKRPACPRDDVTLTTESPFDTFMIASFRGPESGTIVR